MLLADFSYGFFWEVGAFGDALGLLEQAFFEQVLNLDVVLHFDQLVDAELARLLSHLHEYRVFFHLNLEDLRVACIKERKLVVEVVNLYFVQALFVFNLYYVKGTLAFIKEKLEHFLVALQFLVVLIYRSLLFITLNLVLVVDCFKVKHNGSIVGAVNRSRSKRAVEEIVADGSDSHRGLVHLVNALVEKDAVGADHVHGILALAEVGTLIFEYE